MDSKNSNANANVNANPNAKRRALHILITCLVAVSVLCVIGVGIGIRVGVGAAVGGTAAASSTSTVPLRAQEQFFRQRALVPNGLGNAHGAHVPGGPCTDCETGPQSGGVNPQDCQVYFSTTVQPNGSTCTSNCRGGFQIDVVMSTSGPYDGGAPCGNEPGDVVTRSCQGNEGSQACYCSANDFYLTDSSGNVTNPYFDDTTVVTCGSCDNVLNGQSCYLMCMGSDAKLSGQQAIACIAGTWSLPQPDTHNFSRAPSCAPGAQTCALIPEDESLAYAPGGICDGALVGEVCVAYCNPGYILAAGASGVATCTSEGWSTLVGCVPVQQFPPGCPNLPENASFDFANLANGSASVCVGAVAGDVCSVTCNGPLDGSAGYTIPPGYFGSATCMPGGYWSAPIECAIQTPFN